MRSLRLPRDLRLARLPLLLAYLLVLLGTPVGEAGFLWMHLSTAHSTPAKLGVEPERTVGLQLGGAALAGAPEHDSVPAREHEHAHEHRHPAPHEHESAAEHGDAHEHSVAHVDRAAPREHEHAAAHEHASERAAEHAHANADSHGNAPEHRRIASAASEAEDRSFAPHEPHEHGGRVHTHRQHPVPDAALLIDALSKFYLPPPRRPHLPRARTLATHRRFCRRSTRWPRGSTRLPPDCRADNRSVIGHSPVPERDRVRRVRRGMPFFGSPVLRAPAEIGRGDRG